MGLKDRIVGLRRVGRLTGLPAWKLLGLMWPGPARTVTYRGVPVTLRPGTTDIATFQEALAVGYHRSPWLLPERPLIVDLGSNIGVTLLDYALTHPGATLVGVEMDEANHALAVANTRSLTGCRVVHAAVAPEAGTVTYDDSADDDAYTIGTGHREVEAVTVGSLLNGRRADLLKMDVEGAERQLLTEHTDWAQSVDRMLVEVHSPWTVEECIAALRALGFHAERDTRHWASVAATRPGPATDRQ